MPDELLVAILAAGASRRLGRPKQLVEIDGEPLIRRQCLTGVSAAIGPVALVLGCQHEQVASVVSDLQLLLVVNDEWEEGLAASVRAATRAAIAAGAPAMLVYHCDQYALTPADLIRLHHAWTSSPATAYLARDGDHLGPPAILPARVFPSMLTLEGDRGPRAILGGASQVHEVPITTASMDVDYPADLRKLES